MADLNAAARRLRDLCDVYLRAPFDMATSNGDPVFTFVPPLSAGEQVVFNRLVNIARSLVDGITAAEWEALEPDIAGLVTYQGIATPTLAQTALAVKAQSRILRALLKN